MASPIGIFGGTIMVRRRVFLTVLMTVTVLSFFGLRAWADDIDVYTNDNDGVEPNILIIFDNSGSMNETIPSATYDPATTYPGSYQTDTVYYRWHGSWDHVFRDVVTDVSCNEARTALENEGLYNGRILFNTNCGGHRVRYLRTGNYLNFLATDPPTDHPKLGVAKGTIQSYVNTTYGVRFGAMIFNPDQGGHILREVRDMIPQNRSDLHTAIGQIHADTYTPLAETLYEAGLYFEGASSYFNDGVTYTSPVTDWCQKNYVILITDGLSTQDRDPVLETIGNNGDTDLDGADPGSYANGGSDYLDDVAKYLHDRDLRDDLEDRQNLVTYTLGFTINHPLLEDAAEHGRGKYYYVHNAQSFRIAFQNIIQDILEESTSFTAPVVPISQMEKTTSGDSIYLALFQPTEDAFWKGNIKKFSLAPHDTGDIQQGDILDVNGDRATDEAGHILTGAVSFWGSSLADGGETEAGGVGEVLLNRTTPRNLYTWIDQSQHPLTHPNNAFAKTNPGLTSGMLGAADDTERDQIIGFVHGDDVYDEDMDFETTETRRWILGAFLHSRPAVVHYEGGNSVIFAGANDGMLHAFLDSDGSELWGFVPPDLLDRLKLLHGGTLEYLVDGAPRAALIDMDQDHIIEPGDGDQAILVFGERRGGSHYYALDVTDYDVPVLLWEIHPEVGGDFEEMGQSWCSPTIGKVKIGVEDRWSVFLSGGYDTNQDSDPVVGSDTMGRGIYVVDLIDGTLIWKATASDNPLMASCIPSDIAAIDTNDSGYLDRLYVGDTDSRVWRCDIGDFDPANWTAKMIFDDSANGRKIFYPPDVVLEHGYEMLFFGTGDRANPKDETIINRIYALKDSDPSVPLTLNELVDVTANLVQDGTDQQRADTLNDLNAHDGWYLNLDEHVGEKVLAPSIVYFGVAYLTTFIPTDGDPLDPCYVGEGIARLYALDYKTAAARLNFDTSSDDLERSDRSKEIGTAIPSGMVIAILQGMGASYIGVGGGIVTSDLVNPAAILRIFWRQVF
jgi:type IV pilus assembly protein PilY1